MIAASQDKCNMMMACQPESAFRSLVVLAKLANNPRKINSGNVLNRTGVSESSIG